MRMRGGGRGVPAGRADDPLERAIDWMLKLDSGRADAGDRARFEAWLAAHPGHADAWRQVTEAVREPLVPIRGEAQAAASAALRRVPTRRKWIRGAAGLLVAGGAGALAMQRYTPLAELAADVRTVTAERRRLVLDDGSVLTLNARSAVDLHYDRKQRKVALRMGAIYVEVAADPLRPFIVSTPQGDVQALGTAFAVAIEGDASMVAVIEHSVAVRAAGMEVQLHEGLGLYFSAHGIGRADPALAQRASWHSGMLMVRNEPLGVLVQALRPYRTGWIRISERAARLRVLGVFPLDDVDAVLDSLQQTLPVEVRRHGGWLTTIDISGA